MVQISSFLLRIKPTELGKHMGRSFIDRLRIFVKSGKGGRGFGRMGGIGGDGKQIVDFRQSYLPHLFKTVKEYFLLFSQAGASTLLARTNARSNRCTPPIYVRDT